MARAAKGLALPDDIKVQELFHHSEFDPKILQRHETIVGMSGAGKSFTGRTLLARDIDNNRRSCIICPTGVWWGAAYTAKGKRSKDNIIIVGGDHADLPLDFVPPGTLGEFVAEMTNMHVIVDISDLLSDGSKERFVTAFTQTLYQKNKRAMRFLIDEADEFCPQQPMPDQRYMMAMIDRIVRRGRVKGFNVLSITQRPAALHKNILSQANSLIAMRLTSEQDRKAIFGWIKGNVSPAIANLVYDRLPSLGDGEGFLMEPQHGVFGLYKFPMIDSFDSMRAPEDDDPEIEAQGGAIDLDKIRKSLDKMRPPEPKKKAKSGEEVSVTIGDVTESEAYRELLAQYEALKANIEPSRLQAYFHGVEDARLVMEGAINSRPISEWGGPRTGIPVADIKPGVFSRPAVEQVEKNSPVPAPKPAPPLKPYMKVERQPGPVNRSNALAAKILGTAIEIFPLKLNWKSLCMMTGCKSHGPQFNSARAHLLQGDVREERDLVSGDFLVVIANKHEPKNATGLNRDEVLNLWLEKLPAMPSAILAVLADRKSPIAPEDLAHKIGRANHGPQWNSAVNTLKTNGLMIQDAAGRWSLPDILVQGR